MFDFLNLPKASEVNSKIDKKMLYENADLNASAKRWIKEDVERITWCNRIAYDTVNIKGYCDESVDYTEIQVISLELRTDVHANKLYDIILKSMPYPIIVVEQFNKKYLIVAAPVHINQNEKSKLVCEEIISTDWISMDDCFLQKLDISAIKGHNIKDIYLNFIDELLKFNVTEQIGKVSNLSPQESRLFLQKIQSLDSQINKLILEIKKEDQFTRQVELNQMIKKLTRKREQILTELRDVE